MSSENIKEVVREKYGEAAKRVSSGARFGMLRDESCICHRWLRSDYLEPLGRRRSLCDSRSCAPGIARVWQSEALAKLQRVRSCLIWDRAAESMFSCRRGASAPPDKRSDSIGCHRCGPGIYRARVASRAAAHRCADRKGRFRKTEQVLASLA